MEALILAREVEGTNKTGREASHVKDTSSQLLCHLEASLDPEEAHSVTAPVQMAFNSFSKELSNLKKHKSKLLKLADDLIGRNCLLGTAFCLPNSPRRRTTYGFLTYPGFSGDYSSDCGMNHARHIILGELMH